MNEQPPSNFDWVTARAECSAAAMYEQLRDAARVNMKVRNAILNKSEDKDRFRFKDDECGGRSFTIFDSWGHKRRAVDVALKDDVIMVTSQLGDQTSESSLGLTLNDAGQCRFVSDGRELDLWQVLKRALEPLFFGR